jgi:hypothetical protein
MPRRLVLTACGLAAAAPPVPARIEAGSDLEEARRLARRNMEALRKARVDRRIEPAFRFEA